MLVIHLKIILQIYIEMQVCENIKEEQIGVGGGKQSFHHSNKERMQHLVWKCFYNGLQVDMDAEILSVILTLVSITKGR